MVKPNTEGIYFNYNSDSDLLFKEIYSGKMADVSHVKLFHKRKFVGKVYVQREGDVYGREYIKINDKIVYLDTIHTLVPIDRMLENICEKFAITLSELKSDRRFKHLCEPRSIAYYVLRDHYSMGLQNVADMLNKKSHATIMSGARKVRGYMEVIPRYNYEVNSLILTEIHKPECLDNFKL